MYLNIYGLYMDYIWNIHIYIYIYIYIYGDIPGYDEGWVKFITTSRRSPEAWEL